MILSTGWLLLKGAVLLVGIYLSFCGLLFFMQERLLYFPDDQQAGTPVDVGLEFQPLSITTADGLRLDAWWIPAEQQRGVVLFCHGNAGNISHRLESIRQFQQLGLSVLIFDYRGYGRSQGRPDEAGTYQDVQAVWSYLTRERGVAPEQVVVFGRSLGAAIAAHLAARVRPGAVILESGFTSVPDLAARFYPWLPVRWLSRLDYPVARDVQSIRSPLLILHSKEDELIPHEMGLRLYELAVEPKHYHLLHGAHNDGFLRSEPGYSAAINGFLQRYLDTSGG